MKTFSRLFAHLTLLLLFPILTIACKPHAQPAIQTGADAMETYLPLLQGKKVGILTNNTARVGMTAQNPQGVHLVDTLLSLGVNIKMVFGPEHGFRGTADAGGHIEDATDPKTGLPVISLYGKTYIPADSLMQQLDIAVFDIQDVGLRFYTYLSSMYYFMEACARNNVPLLILDRPNPNGGKVSGPVLDMQFRSFVGIVPVPVVHGLTLGEMAMMINGEHWLPDSLQTDVTVIKCRNWTHQQAYVLPIKPSPNLPNNRAIYLYPSLCPFEATPVSVGRGTDFPFQVYGHPLMSLGNFSFTPEPRPGALKPLRNGETCIGYDLRTSPSDESIIKEGFTLKYVIDAYNQIKDSVSFFRSNFFEKLVGRADIRKMITEGRSAEEIASCWKTDLETFKALRRRYLLYKDNAN